MGRDMNSTNGYVNIWESSDDSSLMKEIAVGSPEAMEILMDRYLPMVSRITYRILCDIPESEAVTKEVFLKVWRSAGEYDFRRGVSIWICRIIYNLCYIHLRRQRFLDLLSIRQSVYETSAPQPISPEEDFIAKETWEIYCRASHRLTAGQRAVFVFMELEELPTDQVVDILGMRSDHIRDNLLEVRNKIKQELAKYGKVI